MYYGDYSFDFGRKKRNILDAFNFLKLFGSWKINSSSLGLKKNSSLLDLDKNSSLLGLEKNSSKFNYYGLPFEIYSATPGYQYKDNISNIIIFIFCLILIVIFLFIV